MSVGAVDWTLISSFVTNLEERQERAFHSSTLEYKGSLRARCLRELGHSSPWG